MRLESSRNANRLPAKKNEKTIELIFFRSESFWFRRLPIVFAASKIDWVADDDDADDDDADDDDDDDDDRVTRLGFKTQSFH